jgi:hypothetical protein
MYRDVEGLFRVPDSFHSDNPTGPDGMHYLTKITYQKMPSTGTSLVLEEIQRTSNLKSAFFPINCSRPNREESMRCRHVNW